MSLVSFAKTDSADLCQLEQGIKDSLNLIHYRFSENPKKVVIKPNMCYYSDYSTGQTTNPKFVAAAIKVLRESTSSDVDISIVESDASAMKCRHAFRFLGYERLAEDYNVRLVNLSEDKSEKIDVKVGGNVFHFMIPLTLKNADIKINIPKIKYMENTKISCSLKNIFGCNPEPRKFKYHSMLDEVIVALNKIMKFDVSVLDGIVVSGSRPVQLGLIMASQDPVALDTAAARIAGVNPKSIRHISLACKEGLGKTSVIARGIRPKFFQDQFPRIELKDRILRSAYRFVTWTGLLDPEML